MTKNNLNSASFLTEDIDANKRALDYQGKKREFFRMVLAHNRTTEAVPSKRRMSAQVQHKEHHKRVDKNTIIKIARATRTSISNDATLNKRSVRNDFRVSFVEKTYKRVIRTLIIKNL